MAGGLESAQKYAGAILRSVAKLVARGHNKQVPASDVYREGEIQFLASKCAEAARVMQSIPDNDMGDVRNSANNLRDYQQVLIRAAMSISDGATAHAVSYRMSDKLGMVRFVTEAIQRLQSDSKSAKATVVESAKAHGVARTKAEGGELRSRAAGFIVRMRASMERGYINIDEAKGLMQLLRSSADLENEDRKLVWAMQRSRDIYGTVMANRVRGMGNQMVNVDSEQRRLIGAWLQQIATFISGRTHGYLRKEPLIRRVRG